jgi:uncharacterized protein GlcG (DUF336 family)
MIVAIRFLLSAAAFSVAATGSANAQQQPSPKDLTYQQVKVIAETAYETCATQGFHVSVHIVGRGGETLFAIRGDGAGSTTFENSRRKAYAIRARPDFAIEGGLPILVGGVVVGGIGVNGSQRGNTICARAGTDKAADLLK